MATENIYHLLHFIPAVEAWEMPPELERAAQVIVRSGRLRINADYARNFVHYGTADTDATFTTRELSDPTLLAQTRAYLTRHVPGALGAQGVEDLLQRLQNELKKARGIEEAKELKVARVLVQSAHPAVIQLLIESRTEIFVSYSHNVGDLLAVHAWQTHGFAGGLQATLENGTQVFISCSGDPFFEGAEKTYTTDGWPALARMVVIGAQELGHFADLIRSHGAITGRYSLSAEAQAARRTDIAHTAGLYNRCEQAQLFKLQRIEAGLAFYDKRGRFTPPWLLLQVRRFFGWLSCRRKIGIILNFKTFPAYRFGTAWGHFLDDMAFNLAPQAEAYRRADPAEEEAIACIEAVARVPQQVAKWGHEAVRAAWPQLYALYYGQVTAGCRAAVKSAPPSNTIDLFHMLKVSLRRMARKRPDYYPS